MRTSSTSSSNDGAARVSVAALTSATLALALGHPWVLAGPGERVATVAFDVETIGADGLVGPSGGRRALAYEFCIPAREGPQAQVAAIDSTARLMAASPGRIGCGEGQVLVLGHTHQPGFGQVLRRLAELPFVTRVQAAWFE